MCICKICGYEYNESEMVNGYCFNCYEELTQDTRGADIISEADYYDGDGIY